MEDAKNSLIQSHNEIRYNHNLNLLSANKSLNKAAQKHAEYMANENQLSHYGRYYSKVSDRVQADGYRFRGVAENIAAGQESINEVMDDWMKSMGHRKNILGNYVDIGIGIAESSSGRIYWCVVFGRPLQS